MTSIGSRSFHFSLPYFTAHRIFSRGTEPNTIRHLLEWRWGRPRACPPKHPALRPSVRPSHCPHLHHGSLRVLNRLRRTRHERAGVRDGQGRLILVFVITRGARHLRLKQLASTPPPGELACRLHNAHAYKKNRIDKIHTGNNSRRFTTSLIRPSYYYYYHYFSFAFKWDGHNKLRSKSSAAGNKRPPRSTFQLSPLYLSLGRNVNKWGGGGGGNKKKNKKRERHFIITTRLKSCSVKRGQSCFRLLSGCHTQRERKMGTHISRFVHTTTLLKNFHERTLKMSPSYSNVTQSFGIKNFPPRKLTTDRQMGVYNGLSS